MAKSDKLTQRLLNEWLETKLKEQEDPLVKAPGTIIAKRYRGKQIIRWFFLEDHLKENSRTSFLHGPRKWSAGILGAAPLFLARPLIEELRQTFSAYTFDIHVDPWGENMFNESYKPTLNDISIIAININTELEPHKYHLMKCVLERVLSSQIGSNQMILAIVIALCQLEQTTSLSTIKL